MCECVQSIHVYNLLQRNFSNHNNESGSGFAIKILLETRDRSVLGQGLS
jgi:hypothetical protein